MSASACRALSSSFFARFRRTAPARYAGMLVLSSLLAGCFSSEASIGVVDGGAIVQDSAPGRKAVAHLAQVREVLQGNLNAVEHKLQSYPDKQQAQEILQQAQASLQQALDAHESQINTQLTDILQLSVRECRDAKKLSVMVAKGNLMDYDPALDVSGDVLVFFEKKNVQLPPMPAAVADPPLPAPRTPVASKPAVEEKAKVQDPVRSETKRAARAEPRAERKAESRRRTPKKDDNR